jgi:hypothetical protein
MATNANVETRIAVFDPDAFYPFRSLIYGPLTSVRDLTAIEEFLRAIVLHDEMTMEMNPFSHSEEDDYWSEEDIQAGGRTVISAMGPTTDEYHLFNQQYGPQPVPNISLSDSLVQLARDHSGADSGNVYFDAHLNFLKRVLGVVQNGGSAICRSAFAMEAIGTASRFPTSLFDGLGNDWKTLGKDVSAPNFGPLIPPLLSIVATRSASREKISDIVRDLRDEWSEARSKVWALSDELKTASSVLRAQEIVRELDESSKYFSPTPDERSTRPVQFLWNLCSAALGGAAIGQLSGGNPEIGAAVGLVGETVRIVQKEINWQRICGVGAFDLGKRVRREVELADVSKLSLFLSQTEKTALGL